MNENKVTFGKAIIISVVLLAIITGFIALCGVIGVKEYWFGILFLWFFGLNDVDVTKIKEIVIGGLVGIAGAYILAVASAYGTIGIIATLVVLVALMSLLITNAIPLVVNQATMLTLTVLTLHDLAFPERVFNGFVGFTAGAVFFGGLVALMAYFGKLKANKQQASE